MCSNKLAGAGVGEAVVNVHYLPDQIIDHVAKRTAAAGDHFDERAACRKPAAAFKAALISERVFHRQCRPSGPRRASKPDPGWH